MKPAFEKVDKNLYSSFKVIEHKNQRDFRAYHFHPEFEIVFISKGKGKRFVGDHIGFFNQKDFVLIGENLPHCWIQEEGIDAVVLQFDRESFLHSFENLPELKGVSELLKKAETGIHFKEVPKSLTKKLEAIVELEGLERLICFLQIMNHLVQLKDSDTLSSFAFKNHQVQKHRIDKVLNYIYENMGEELDVNVAAGILNMNVSAFCHYFKKTTNRTFSNFVNHIRIGYASKMLIETDKNISELAFESGYNSLSNFNKRFRELKGLSPKQYRQKYL